MSDLFQELKRRNVFRVAIAYVAIAWLTLQVADIVFENIGAPDWVMKAVMFILAIGFPIAVLFAWAYELTPEGIKKEKEVDRSQSITRETGQKLNRTIIVVLVAAVAFLLADKFMFRQGGESPAATEKSVAVLPFVAMSRGPDDEYFADGLTEEILNSLARVPELLVTARTSAFHFKGQDIPIPEIAAALGVAHIVEGSVRRDGDQLRVTAQLIRAEDGFHLWSKNYDRQTVDTFGVQTDIAEEISSALGIVLNEEQQARMREAGIRDPGAYIALQKGYEAFDRAHGSADQMGLLLEANEWFDKALKLEPNIADAYLAHADYYTHRLLNSVDDPGISTAEQDTAYQRLVSDYDNAIRVAEDESRKLSAAFDLAMISGSWRSAPGLFSRLVNDSGCAGIGWADAISAPYGRAEELGVLAQRLVECDPLSFNGWRWLSLSQIWAGEADAAIATARRGMDVSPHLRIAQQLFFAHLAAGRIDDAEQVIARHVRGEGPVLNLQRTLAAVRGDAELAETLAARASAVDTTTSIGVIAGYAVRGARDAANRRAAEVDAHPFGHLRLMLVPGACLCGAPWDLEYTPNFAKLLDDAELPWPPASPVEWPLKDW
jgi:TolB-like protein/tetratricopeptide (TPR) repeat protein